MEKLVKKTTAKIDLHTHSDLSYDGGITAEEYQAFLQSGKLTHIAVTDHNEIKRALELRKALGPQIIVGEEIKTKEGEIIGLFLKSRIKPNMSFEKTLDAIHKQGGITYIPHPFDIRRSGAGRKVLTQNIAKIDIIEGFNARAITPRANKKAQTFAEVNGLRVAAGSDSHSVWELGKTYIQFEMNATKKLNLTKTILLRETEKPWLVKKYVSPRGFIAPAWNKYKKWTNSRKN